MKIVSEKEMAQKVSKREIDSEDFSELEDETKMAREFKAMGMSLHELMQACLATDKVNSEILRKQSEIIKSIIGMMTKTEKKTDMVFDIVRGKDGKISSIKVSVN